MFKKDDRNMESFQVWICKAHAKEIKRLAKLLDLKESRLIAYSIDHELTKEKPFEVDLTLPDQDYVEFAYAAEAGRLLNYVKKLRVGMSLDLLYTVRHDFGVPDKHVFLAALQECLNKGVIEAYDAPATVKFGKVSEGGVKYRAKVNDPVVRKKVMKKESEREKYLKLHAKYGKK